MRVSQREREREKIWKVGGESKANLSVKYKQPPPLKTNLSAIYTDNGLLKDDINPMLEVHPPLVWEGYVRQIPWLEYATKSFTQVPDRLFADSCEKDFTFLALLKRETAIS